MANIFRRFWDAVSREYDRRIRRASQITQYKSPDTETHAPDEDEGDVEIVNIPRGTSVSPTNQGPREN